MICGDFLKVESGDISVAVLAQVQSYCQAQEKKNQVEISAEEKMGMVDAVEGCSRREAERVLASMNPEQALPKPERERRVNGFQMEVRVLLSDEVLAKLTRIKEVTAHKNPNPSYAELIEYMAEVVLDRIDPIRKAKKQGAADQPPRSPCDGGYT